MIPPRNTGTRHKSYEAAAEAARERELEEFLEGNEEQEEDPMDEADRRYDEWQDEQAGR